MIVPTSPDTVWIEIQIYGSIKLLCDYCISFQDLKVSRILKVPREDKQEIVFNSISCGQGALEILVRSFYRRAEELIEEAMPHGLLNLE